MQQISVLNRGPRLKHLLTIGILLLVSATESVFAQCPDPPLATITAPQPPADVCIPDGFAGNPITFFDDFSWRSFIAMVWPVQQGMRGVPDTSKSIGPVSGPLVFETLKADWEVFQPSPDGTSPPPAPAPWESYAGQNPCSNLQAPNIIGFDPTLRYPIFGVSGIGFGDVVLAAFSKFGNVGLAGFGDLVGTLPAQNGTYTRYLASFNQTEFNQILNQGLYLRSNLPTAGATLTFQDGSIDLKSAWIDMTNVQNPQRYYKRTAWVLNPFATPSPTCTQTTVGLVGFHIVTKTPSRPQWIWSTFEQIDNVPGGASPGPFAYNSGDGSPMPASNPDPWPPTSATPTIFNVQRLTPINPFTVNTNVQYQRLLQAAGAPWQFYQLVMTQWPVAQPPLPEQGPVPATQAGTPPFTFPGTAPPSAFANVTLETFDQTNITTGCMNCHDSTRQQTDFLWFLQINAWPSTIPPASTPMLALRPSPRAVLEAQRLPPELEALKELMQRAARH
jgi:hypothetical protein